MGKQTNDPNDSKHEQKLQAILLADSFTQSFRPLTSDENVPKVLCPLNNVVMLDYAMDFLAGNGIQEVYVYCVSNPELVEEYVRRSDRVQTNKSVMTVHCITDVGAKNPGDALREMDKRGLIRSDPFVLMSGDVVSNVNLKGVMKLHKERKKKDSSAIMTVCLKDLGVVSDASGAPPAIRSTSDDLVVGYNPSTSQIVLFDDTPHQSTVSLPCSFVTSNLHSSIRISSSIYDCGIDVCSPEVLARFSDEFDYRSIRKQFIHNSVAEEEEGLQNKIHAHFLSSPEYASRISDVRSYHATSRDLLRRWCYPVVPDWDTNSRGVKYDCGRHFVYRERGGSGTIARSSTLGSMTMIGSGCTIGENCSIKGTVIGNNCILGNNVTLLNTHLWDNVIIDSNVSITDSILANHSRIQSHATIPKGCIIGRHCVIGTRITLPPYTRITKSCGVTAEDDDDEFSDSSSDDNSWSDTEELKEEAVAHSDHNVVGEDGVGQLWDPVKEIKEDDYHDDSDDESVSVVSDTEENPIASQSMGYDATPLYQQRQHQQSHDFTHKIANDEDDLFHDESVQDDDENSSLDDDDDHSFTFDNDINHHASTIIGRQKGVNVIGEMKALCLEHDRNNSLDNLAIELNSFKFSQNATYADCCTGATQAILELVCTTLLQSSQPFTPEKFATELRKELSHWIPLYTKLNQNKKNGGASSSAGSEEMAILTTFETTALLKPSSTSTTTPESDPNPNERLGIVLRTEPSFRYVLQTLHDLEIVAEETILHWAGTVKSALENDGESSSVDDDADVTRRRTLFEQSKTQDFLSWLEEEEETDSEDSDDDSDEESE